MAASLPQRGGRRGGGRISDLYGWWWWWWWWDPGGTIRFLSCLLLGTRQKPRTPTCKVPICCLAMALGGEKKSSIAQYAATPTLTVTPRDRFFYLTAGIFAFLSSANNCLSPRYKCIHWNVKTFLLPSKIALCPRSRIESGARCAGATRHETVQHKWGCRGERASVASL